MGMGTARFAPDLSWVFEGSVVAAGTTMSYVMLRPVEDCCSPAADCASA